METAETARIAFLYVLVAIDDQIYLDSDSRSFCFLGEEQFRPISVMTTDHRNSPDLCFRRAPIFLLLYRDPGWYGVR